MSSGESGALEKVRVFSPLHRGEEEEELLLMEINFSDDDDAKMGRRRRLRFPRSITQEV